MICITANSIIDNYIVTKKKMKTLLVPTDFSECALRAIHTAVPIAIATGAKIILLHNVYTETKWESFPNSRRLEYPETIKRIKKAESKMSLLMKNNLFKKVKTSNIISYGIAYEEIVSRAKQLKVDLILMGSHGNEVSERYFIGSTIQKVLREATCPVMTVQKDFKPGKWKKLAFATNFEKEIYKPFERVRKLAHDLNAIIYLIFINRPTDFVDTRSINNMMDNFIKRYPDVKFQKVIYNHEDIAEGILQFTEDNPMDWIALITQNRKWKPTYLIGHTETLVFRSTIPVLSMNILPMPLK